MIDHPCAQPLFCDRVELLARDADERQRPYAGDSRTPTEEIDLLIADHGTLIACEVKKDGGSLSADEAIAHIELGARVRAEPIFAASAGDWRGEVPGLFDTHDFRVLGPSDLLDRPA